MDTSNNAVVKHAATPILQERLLCPPPSLLADVPVLKSQAVRGALLLAANYAALFVGSVSSTLLSRFYFAHGGTDRWLATLVQSAGFPALLPLLLCARRRPFNGFTPRVVSCVGIWLKLGFQCGLTDHLGSK
jgi:hypothetical protein